MVGLARVVCRVLPRRGEDPRRALGDLYLARHPVDLCSYLDPVDHSFQGAGRVTVEVSGVDPLRQVQTDLGSTHTAGAQALETSVVVYIDDFSCGDQVSVCQTSGFLRDSGHRLTQIERVLDTEIRALYLAVTHNVGCRLAFFVHWYEVARVTVLAEVSTGFAKDIPSALYMPARREALSASD